MARAASSRRRAVVSTAIAGVVVLASCGAPRYHYVKSSSDHTFLRVPRAWKLYDEDALLATSDEPDEAKDAFKELTWSVAFDAAPRPSLDNLLSAADHPTGIVQVRRLLPQQRETFSPADLRGILLRFDPLDETAPQRASVDVIAVKNVTRPGGFRGSDLVLNLRSAGGQVIKWRQIAVLDDELERAHVLVVTCTAACYSANEKVIDRLIDSWKVKER